MKRKTGLTLASILVPLALVAGCASSLPDRITQPMFTAGLHIGETRQEVRVAARRFGKVANRFGRPADPNEDTYSFGTLNLLAVVQGKDVVAHFDRNGALQSSTVTPTSAAM